jgi:hypothetical protein
MSLSVRFRLTSFQRGDKDQRGFSGFSGPQNLRQQIRRMRVAIITLALTEPTYKN